MAESTEIPNPDAEAIKVADKIMTEYYEIEEKVFKLNSIEATQFLIQTLKEVIIELGGEKMLEDREAG